MVKRLKPRKCDFTAGSHWLAAGPVPTIFEETHHIGRRDHLRKPHACAVIVAVVQFPALPYRIDSVHFIVIFTVEAVVPDLVSSCSSHSSWFNLYSAHRSPQSATI
jgi:hypothetical protein